MTTMLTELDVLAPFEIWEVPLGNGAYIKFFQPLVLQPTQMPHDPDEPGDVEYWEVEVPELGISAWGKNRKELWSSVKGDILMLWTRWVQNDDTNLTAATRAIKRNYLAIAEEIDG